MHDHTIDNLRKIRQIPPPDAIAQEIIRVVSNDQLDLIDLVSVIDKSPTITANILRCANSAYYSQRREISTVREAIIRVLGLSITGSLALAMSLSSHFKTEKNTNFDRERYWFNAVTTAGISQEMAHHVRVRTKPDPATAYTAGLLYNIGLQALLYVFPEQMETILSGSSSTLRERLLSQ